MNARSDYTYVQVEPSDNCPMSASQVYKNLSDPFSVATVRIYEGEPGGALYSITGWFSQGGGTPVAAFAVEVEDSSAGAGFVVYGGDWGVRLKPVDSDDTWRLADPNQLGETHLVLADRDDIIARGA